MENHNKAKAVFIQHKIHQTRTAWNEKNGIPKYGKGHYKTLETLNGDNTEKRQTVIESQNEHLTQKRPANCFAHMYQEESTVNSPEKVQGMSETKSKYSSQKTYLLTDE